jgi:two-component system NtrC family sensor kinase
MTGLPQDMVADLRQENARLLAELRAARDRQAGSAEILSTIAGAPGDAERALQKVAETTARLFGASSVTIRIPRGDEWGQSINVGAGSERIAAEVSAARLRLGARNLPSTVLGENRQVHIPDLDNPDPAIADWPGIPPARAAGTRAMAGTPLRREGKAIGVLIVHRDRPEPFTAEELALQQSFADQAVIAIENARLFNETKEALERQTATADILKVIASSPSDVQPVFEAIATSANRLIGGFSIAVFRFVDREYHLAAFTPTNPAADKGLIAMFPRPLADVPAFEWVRGGEASQIVDAESEPAVRDIARLRGYRSMLFMPLMSSGAPIGMISVTRKEPGKFAEHHVQLLQTFADQAVIAIENARLFDEVQARTRDLSESLQQQTATADVLKVISRSAFDLQTVLDTLVESAARLSEAENGIIARQTGSGFHAVAGYGHAPQRWATIKNFPIEAGRGTFIGRTIVEGRTVHVPDVLADPEFEGGSMQQAVGYRSVLCIPLLREGVPIGVIGLARNSVRPFTDKQIELVSTFADQAVIAIENVRLFDEVQAKTRDLSEALTYQTGSSNILKVIASSPTDVGPVLKAIVESACELCDADDAVVHLREGDDLRYSAHHGPIPVGLEKRPISRNWVTGRSVVDKLPIHLHDVLSAEGAEFPEAQQMSRRQGIRTILSAPLLRENESIGAIVLRRTKVNPFSEKQIALLQTFADQAVIALGNVRLFEEVQARTEDLRESLQQQTATADVLKVISNSSGDLQPVFDAMLANATRICEARFGMMWLIEGDAARCVALHNAPEAFAELRQREPIIRPSPHTAMGRLLKTKQVVHIEDARAERAYVEGDPVRRANADLAGARTIVAVPMLKENEVIGAIGIFHQEVHPFTDKQIELVTNFANQAVIAIENTRLLNELRQRTTELSQSLDDLRTAQDRLVQTEKLASLGQLTAGIAHEIKNPLNFVNNFSALSAELTDELNEVLKPATLSDKIREEVDELTGLLKANLDKVVQHGKRADSIVKNMLLHSREEAGEHRPADINALLDESLNLAYHGARAEKPQFNVTLRRDFDEMAGTIELFPQEITRVFLNLISNGFYAVTKRKTEIGNSGFEPVVSATTRNLGDRVEIRIRDNGTGIPADVKDKMFNPFFTTKPAGEGTGLGLSMSHDIVVKQHGGRIDVDTEPGHFTEFTIVLPRTSNFSNKIRGQT